MIVPLDTLIEMVSCCYFIGNCKLCPFYKAPKFGVIGSCVGQKKVGDALLDTLLSYKAKEEAEQLDLFEESAAGEAETTEEAGE